MVAEPLLVVSKQKMPRELLFFFKKEAQENLLKKKGKAVDG